VYPRGVIVIHLLFDCCSGPGSNGRGGPPMKESPSGIPVIIYMTPIFANHRNRSGMIQRRSPWALSLMRVKDARRNGRVGRLQLLQKLRSAAGMTLSPPIRGNGGFDEGREYFRRHEENDRPPKNDGEQARSLEDE
jgi:hypothetical protein